MREFNIGWRSADCEKCGHDPYCSEYVPKAEFEKVITEERNNIERLNVTCKVCGYSYYMECQH